MTMDQNGLIYLRWPSYLLLWARAPQKQWSSPHSRQESPKCSTWMQSQKWQNVRFQGKPFNITVIQVYDPTRNAEKAEVEWFYDDLRDLELTPKKMSFSL